MKKIKIDIEIDCRGENCPMPLVKTREAILNSNNSQVIEITGTHPESFEEIPMALESMSKEIINMEKNADEWKIVFRV